MSMTETLDEMLFRMLKDSGVLKSNADPESTAQAFAVQVADPGTTPAEYAPRANKHPALSIRTLAGRSDHHARYGAYPW